MAKKQVKIEKGDLVKANGIWGGKIGVVVGDESDWWCIKDHFDVRGCIVEREDIQLIRKALVPIKYIKYFNQ